jgi:hypothetical protein
VAKTIRDQALQETVVMIPLQVFNPSLLHHTKMRLFIIYSNDCTCFGKDSSLNTVIPLIQWAGT